jgi:hypothetical protein
MHKTDDPTMPPLAALRALRLDWWNRQPKRRPGEGMLYLLGDEPTPFSPLYEWERHLDLLLSLEPNSAQAQRMVAAALETMRWIVERERTLMEGWSDDAIAEISAEHGVTPEEIRADPRAYIWDTRDSYISFELPRIRSPKKRKRKRVRKPKKAC